MELIWPVIIIPAWVFLGALLVGINEGLQVLHFEGKDDEVGFIMLWPIAIVIYTVGGTLFMLMKGARLLGVAIASPVKTVQMIGQWKHNRRMKQKKKRLERLQRMKQEEAEIDKQIEQLETEVL